jgi:hypothetical protein
MSVGELVLISVSTFDMVHVVRAKSVLAMLMRAGLLSYPL